MHQHPDDSAVPLEYRDENRYVRDTDAQRRCNKPLELNSLPIMSRESLRALRSDYGMCMREGNHKDRNTKVLLPAKFAW